MDKRNNKITARESEPRL